MDIMPIDHVEDWEERLERQDAFWDREVIDRPVINITLPRENPDYPQPADRSWDSERDRWLDTSYVAEKALADAMNRWYLGDALPYAYPNLGPSVFNAFFGAELGFAETTSWAEPMLRSWDDAHDLDFTRDNFYFQKLVEMTDALMDIGEGKFYTGITDLHPGGDALMSFRESQHLAMDLIEHPDEVSRMVDYVTDVFFEVYDFFADKLLEAGQAINTWAGIVSTRRWYVPSNDFSCMISNEMFREFFLPGIEEECEHLEASIYHLDGPGALQHLDSLLEISQLDAVQWVPGAGNGPASDWLDVYHRCQDAGKGLQITLHVDELDLFMDELYPAGLWIRMAGVENREHGERILEKVQSWT
ncbi:MAG: hypothetical protein ACOCTQ_01745 [Planctomycetota bacterium]